MATTQPSSDGKGELHAFFQGKVVPISQAKVSVMTHALHYGTGVFEGIRGNWNQEKELVYIFRLRDHYQRLVGRGPVPVHNTAAGKHRFARTQLP